MSNDNANIDLFINHLENGSTLHKNITESLKVIEESIEKYGMNELVVSFNGGKDACVIFHLVKYVLCKQGKSKVFGQPNSKHLNKESLDIIYFANEETEFPEILSFLDETKSKNDIDYYEITGSFKDGMQKLVNDNKCGVIMGLRKGDPYTENTVTHFEASSEGWPEFMRIYPILNWTYGHVWSFLRGCKLPYCVLYDRGYTSIGNVNDTVQNEALLANENEHYQNGETKQYKPAYELECEELERSNRLVKGKQYVESS